MADEARMITVGWQELKQFETEAFEKAGLLPEDAAKVADTLIQADLRGVMSHGALHLIRYTRRLRGGGANPRPNMKIVNETETTALLDGDNAPGQMVGIRAMEIAMEKAKGRGIACVSCFRSNHYGAGAYYPMMAADKGFIAYGTTNAPALLAPWGGLRPTLGNNPITYAVPAGKEPPIVMDIALSVAARGKVRMAAAKGMKIPLDWATDREGVPTDDPQKALEGLLLPVAGYKGYGMIIVSEVLSAIMSGANFGKSVRNTLDNTDTPWNIGHFFMAIDVNAFMPMEQYTKRMEDFIQEMKSVPKAKGVERIYVPGEIEYLLREERLKTGIPHPVAVFEDLKTVAKEFGVKAQLPWP